MFSAVAANYLTWCESQAETHGDWTAFDRFVDLVEEAGCPELLRELGQLELGSLVQRFPRTFFSFVDAIDPRRNPHDAEKLHQLFQLLDPDRIDAAQSSLGAGLQRAERAEKILAVARERTLPFVHILIATDRERWLPAIAGFIGDMPEPLEEAGLFRLMKPEEIPGDWIATALRALIDPAARKTLRSRTAELLASFLDATAYDALLLDERVFAINLLGKCPCTASLKALHRIASRKKMFGIKREDPALRDAATLAIQQIEGSLNSGGSRV